MGLNKTSKKFNPGKRDLCKELVIFWERFKKIFFICMIGDANVIRSVGFILCRITPEKQFYNTSGGKFITPFGPWEPIWAGPMDHYWWLCAFILPLFISFFLWHYEWWSSVSLSHFSFISTKSNPPLPSCQSMTHKARFWRHDVNGWWNLLVLVPWLSTNNGWCWWWGKCIR